MTQSTGDRMSTGAQRTCGGCRGLGAHSPKCTTQPGWQWKRLSDVAESLGDQIGSNDPELANMAYHIAGEMTARWQSQAVFPDADR